MTLAEKVPEAETPAAQDVTPQAWEEGLILEGPHRRIHPWGRVTSPLMLKATWMEGCTRARHCQCQTEAAMTLMPLEFAGGFSLLPPLLWLLGPRPVLTSGRS